ncbi:NAD-dependent epimerase/dehydratase family protein [Pseudonocardiaceae bacterium YIM PH 21723]|nr:NAD-dependent epimerase/dehydratase family protein [Pseudonocardiaceae bacterium YIM PH 21723]
MSSIAIFGAGGQQGQELITEALSRGHQVTAVVRNPGKTTFDERVAVVTGDATDGASVASIALDHDVIISAVNGTETVVAAAHALAAKAAKTRVLFVGGAGGLQAGDGLLIDSPGFPDEYKAIAQAHIDALEVWRAAEGVEWTVVSPGALLSPGERRGSYRTGGEELIVDADGNSAISYADLAIAILDEVENPKHPNQRFSTGY